MIDITQFPLSQDGNRSYASWAATPKRLPRWRTRRTTGAIIRFPSMSWLRVALLLFGFGAVGLGAQALMLIFGHDVFVPSGQ